MLCDHRQEIPEQQNENYVAVVKSYELYIIILKTTQNKEVS